MILLNKLDQAAATGLDMSPGDSLAREAAEKIRSLRAEVDQLRSQVKLERARADAAIATLKSLATEASIVAY